MQVERVLQLTVTVILCMGLAACSGSTLIVRQSTPPQGTKPSNIAIADIQWLHELEKTPEDKWFEKGNALGFIQHRGGLVEPETAGARIHSKETQISRKRLFREIFSGWHGEQIQKALGARAIQGARNGQLERFVAPERIRKFGEVSETGTDNVNIPTLYFNPPPVWSGATKYADSSEAQAVLVPIVAYYYGHNPGWFYGQTWGCSSGARARVIWLVYDTSNGSLIAWWDIEAGIQEERVRQPEEGIIEQMAVRVLKELAGLLLSEVDL